MINAIVATVLIFAVALGFLVFTIFSIVIGTKERQLGLILVSVFLMLPLEALLIWVGTIPLNTVVASYGERVGVFYSYDIENAEHFVVGYNFNGDNWEYNLIAKDEESGKISVIGFVFGKSVLVVDEDLEHEKVAVVFHTKKFYEKDIYTIYLPSDYIIRRAQ